MPAIAAIVLAAGPSTRLGRSKQLLKIGGQTLVRRSALAAIDGGCAPVFVVIGADAPAVAAEIKDLPVVTVTNNHWPAGMGTSLAAGVGGVQRAGGADGVAILLCDQPRLNADLLKRLIAAWQSSGRPMAACAYANTIGPPCCFAASMFDELLHLSGDHGAKRLLLATDADRLIRLDWPDGALDIDTPQDAAPHVGPS
jgi:molybdenum cofactor cytidylyltransferase